MRWLELSVETSAEFVEPLSHVFHRYGHGGVSVEQSGGFNPDEGEGLPSGSITKVKTYLPIDSSMESRRSGIDVGIKLISYLCDVSPIEERVLEEQDWEEKWKEHFYVQHVGQKFAIVPTWRNYKPSGSEIVLNLDPGMAFGTGHHPTTRMCLELLEEHCRSGMEVLDFGCGSGILSIAAHKLGAAKVMGMDVDSVAVEAASANVRMNSSDECVSIILGTLPHTQVSVGNYDIVLSNISTSVILDLSNELLSSIKLGGLIILSGILKDRQEEISECLGNLGVIIDHVEMDGDWISVVARKT